ncbi:fungal-specific transcription factor domain-containing protein, partial [Apiospora arundinis]
CDGNNPCARCNKHGIAHCAYETPSRQSKDSLRQEIDELRRQLDQKNTVLSALVNPQSPEEVLTRSRGGESVDIVSKVLEGTLHSEEDAAVPAVDSASSLARPQPKQPSDEMTALPEQRPGRTAMADGIQERDPAGTVLPGIADHGFMGQMSIPIPLSNMGMFRGAWTSVTEDTDLVQHLLALYFCWEYPTFTTIHKEFFLADFLSGKQKFCSAALVNALLALGCLFSSQVGIATSLDDPHTLGDQFFKETLRLIAQETSQYSLTTVQAFGILSIREARCGRNVESRYYAGQSMRLAVEMGLHQVGYDPDMEDMAVSVVTFWGAFTLNNAWSMVMGLLPLSSRAPLLPSKPPTNVDIEASPWTPYPAEGHSLLDTYTRYLDWYGKIPAELRLGINFTPAVLLVHIYYHCAILLLFRPFIKLRIDGSSLYTLRRTPSFLPYLTLISATMHLTAATVEINESSPKSSSSTMSMNDIQHIVATVPLDFADLANVISTTAFRSSKLRSELPPPCYRRPYSGHP